MAQDVSHASHVPLAAAKEPAVPAAVGAATAAGLLAGLDANQLRHALAIAATMAAGLQQAFRGDTQTKPLHAGHAADAGMIAVAQAGGGVKGALDILEAPAGMGAAMSADVDWTAALADR